jgi:uncharacterized protein (DUF433 family)
MPDMTIEPEPVPLRWDDHGRLMVVGHRTPLEIIVHAYRRGRSAEAIHESYPSLALADIYVLLAFYLRNQDQIDAYVDEQDRLGEEARARHELAHPVEQGLRAKLLARLEESERTGRTIQQVLSADSGDARHPDPQ